ncbi:activator of Hsp90 ATPase-like protein [Sediminitomix flava]|uniref:Activator of Hsp90 ATPase-like protein n=2 Tax=Sediminitomix flava TaxID=379075 RepID=A0A315Z782_SEDFL|nr:activator of Hsp90 ATPase-like protein [Sediminitomix flava]
MLFIGLFFAVIIVLFLIGRKSANAEVFINAKPDKVWGILMNTAKYKDWNTVMIPLKGDLKEGNTVTYEFHQDEKNKYEIPSKVKKIETNKLLNQGGGMSGILTFDHKYILEEKDGGTKLTIHEDYRGIGVPFWSPKAVEKAYQRLAEDLKKAAE